MTNNEKPTTNQEISVYDIIIVGGGVAALSAGIYAGRDGYNTLILEGTIVSSTDAPGGALLLTESIENFPGYVGGSGDGLIATIREQAQQFGANIVEERAQVLEPTLVAGELHTVTSNTGAVYQAKSIIIATGAVARMLGVPGEQALVGSGVSTCATCDGWAFKDQNVVVVGGGDTAVEDALLLSKLAKHVTVIVRGKKFRTQSPEARELLVKENVSILWDTVVAEIHASETGKVHHVTIQQNVNGSMRQEELLTDGVFVAIGSDPATGFLKSSIIMLDKDGYILTVDESTRVQGAIPGVFAAGDVNASQKQFRQAVTSAGNGVQAALEARAYLNSPVPQPAPRATKRY